MEDPLKRLLDAEARARKIIDAATAGRQSLMDEALTAAREAEFRFEARRAGMRAPFMNEARNRAEQSVAELAHKYQEHHQQLRGLAARHELETVTAALDLFLDPAL